MFTDEFYKNQLAQCGLLKIAAMKYHFWSADFLAKIFRVSKHTINYYRKNKIEFPEPDISSKFIRINYSHLHLLNAEGMPMDLIDYGVVSLLQNYNRKHKNTFVYEDTMAKHLHITKSNLVSSLSLAEHYSLIKSKRKNEMITRTVTDKWEETQKQSYGFDIFGSLRSTEPEEKMLTIEEVAKSFSYEM